MTYTTEPWDDFRKKYKENPDIDFDFRSGNTTWSEGIITLTIREKSNLSDGVTKGRIKNKIPKKHIIIIKQENILVGANNAFGITVFPFDGNIIIFLQQTYMIWFFSGQIVYKRVFLKDLLKKKILYWIFYKNL